MKNRESSPPGFLTAFGLCWLGNIIKKFFFMATVFTQENFDQEVLGSKGVALVDFFAQWCGPCQMMSPTIDELAQEFEGKAVIGKVDVDKSPELAGQYGVMSIPTIVIFRDGKEVNKIIGAQSKEVLLEAINNA